MNCAQTPLMEELINAEVGVLGSMLLDERAVGPMLLAVREEDFRTPERRNIYRAIRQRYSTGAPVDPLLIGEDLGPAYRPVLYQLMEATPTAANADAYADALRRSSRLLCLRDLGRALEEAADEDACRAVVDKANLLFCERSEIRRMTMPQAYQDFFRRRDGEQRPDFLRWGFADLDERLHVGPGDMVVIGGYASAGKTAFALQLAFRIAQDKRVGFFSYETGADKLADRTVACQTLTSFGRIMRNQLSEEDYKRIADMQNHLTRPTMDFLEASGMTVASMNAYAMAMHYDVVVIDYLQKIPAPRGARISGEFERVSQVSSDLQQMGRTTGKTVIALSQLSRPEKAQSGKLRPPSLSSLRQSGQIEQDADVVLLLYKERPSDPRSRRVLDFAKNKDGVAGMEVLLDFDGDNQRFRRSVSQKLDRPEEKPETGGGQMTWKEVTDTGDLPF